MSTGDRLRWLLRANLIPPLFLVQKREGAERGIERVLGNWERIERHMLARVPANPSLLESERQDLSALLVRLARERNLWVRLRLVWLSSLTPAMLLPPAFIRLLGDRVVRLELELSKPHGKED
jgi:hypothetical protein